MRVEVLTDVVWAGPAVSCLQRPEEVSAITGSLVLVSWPYLLVLDCLPTAHESTGVVSTPPALLMMDFYQNKNGVYNV